MRTRLHLPTPQTLALLAKALRRGELVAIPTETVYGLAANALDAKACKKIFRAKRRPANDPLIVHVSSLRDASAIAEINGAARALAKEFWPGPLTIVLPKKAVVPAIVTSGQETVAVRSPAHPLARRLLQLAKLPLAAPSANPFGYVSPTTAEHVLAGLRGRIGHILDGGPCTVGVESTIVDLTHPKRVTILRPGAVTAGDLRRALNAAGLKLSVVPHRKRSGMLAPGLLDQHYSPHTPFALSRRLKASDDAGSAHIYWKKPAKAAKRAVQYWFSTSGEAELAARNIYAVLRRVDAGGYRRILCEPAPASAGPLALAINDRLARAAGKRR